MTLPTLPSADGPVRVTWRPSDPANAILWALADLVGKQVHQIGPPIPWGDDVQYWFGWDDAVDRKLLEVIDRLIDIRLQQRQHVALTLQMELPLSWIDPGS